MSHDFGDNYQVIRSLGRGGMGEVFLVREKRAGELRALKVLSNLEPEAVARLRDEFAALARIDHLNIVRVFDYGSLPDGRPYFTMEYTDGRTLDEAVSPGDVPGALESMRGVLAGLDALYAAGLVHCDLKPSNIIVLGRATESESGPHQATKGEQGTDKITSAGVRVLDFGLAGRLTDRRSEKVRGTPGYVAPEVLDGGPYTRESDAYALGATLYRVLSGRPPFPGRDAAAILAAQRGSIPSALALRAMGIPRALEHVVLQLMAPDPSPRGIALEELRGLLVDRSLPPSTLWESGAVADLGRGELVGRAGLLTRLKTHLLRGDMRVAVISSPRGMGRTRLARELAIEAELEGWSVIWTDADHPSLPTRSPATTRRTLVVLDDLDLWPSHEVIRLDLAISGARAYLVTTSPNASREGWHRKFLQLEEDPAWLELELPPLDDSGVADLVAARLGSEPPVGLSALLRRSVGGTPRTLHDALDRLMSTGAMRRFGNHWQLDERVAPKLLESVRATADTVRWTALPAASRRILFALAGWFQPASPEILAHLTGTSTETAQAILKELEWLGWVERNDSSWQMPDVLARAIRDSDDPAIHDLRQRITRALTESIAGETPAPIEIRARLLRVLATHQVRLGMIGEARLFALEAAEFALKNNRTEFTEACDLLESMPDVSGEEQAKVLARLAAAWRAYDDPARAITTWQAAIRALSPEASGLRAELSLSLSDVLCSVGSYNEAVDVTTDAISAIKPVDDVTRLTCSRLFAQRGVAHRSLGRSQEAIKDFRDGLRILPESALSDRVGLLTRLGLLEFTRGEPDRGRGTLQDALGFSEACTDSDTLARLHGALALVARIESRYEASAEYSSRALHWRRLAGDPVNLALSLANLAATWSRSGDWASMEAASAEVEQLARRTGNELLLLNVLATQIAAAARRGLVRSARRLQRTERKWIGQTTRPDAHLHRRVYLAEIARLVNRDRVAFRSFSTIASDAAEANEPAYAAYAHEGLGRISLKHGRFTVAERSFRSVLARRSVEPEFVDSAWLGLARIALIQHRPELWREANEGLSREPPRALGAECVRDEVGAIGDLLEGRFDDACGGARRAIEALVGLDLLPRAIECGWTCGRALGQAGAVEQAAVLLQRAHALARMRGLSGWSGLIADDVLELGHGADLASTRDTETGNIRDVLSQVGEVLNSILDFPELLRRSLALVCQRIGAERGFILLVDPVGGDPRPVASFGVVDDETRESALEVSRTVVRRVAESGEAFRSDDATQDPRLGSTMSVLDMALRSLLCVPLRLKESIIGAIYAESRSSVAAFSSHELMLVEAYSNLVATTIQNSRLHDELRKSRDRVIQENLSLRREVSGRYQRTNLLGQSAEIERILSEVERVAVARGSVLITGESGTGKELIAKTIHFASPRAERPFLSLNCAALPPDLIEAELFGIEDQVATGVRSRAGVFERADGGTLFLDEIGDMPLALQAKLLRVLQEREFTRIGGSRVVRVDIRLIAATNQELKQLIRDQKFREDLYFRVSTFPIHVPPIRERKVDIPILARHFVERFCEENGLPVPRMSSDFMGVLLRSSWPGNVRELQNYIERSLVMSRAPVLEPVVLPSDLEEGSPLSPRNAEDGATIPGPVPADIKVALEDMERRWILKALEASSGNQRRAARALGILEPTLRYRISRLRIPAGRSSQTSSRPRKRRQPKS